MEPQLRRKLASATVTFLSAAAVACAQPPPPPPAPPPPAAFEPAAYPWLAEWSGELPPAATLTSMFPAPEGCRRTAAEPGSFAAWLRGLPVRLDRRLVHSFRGRPIPAQAAAVVLLDLGSGDLQQCADTIIRLHAEHLWAGGRADRAAYHFTSGDLSSWRDWVSGVRWVPQGRLVRRQAGPPRIADHASYRAWLQQLFVYAGTLSLASDSSALGVGDAIEAGDFFVDPGSPGHAVVVLDTVTRGDDRRLGLIGQGYAPAQELHVIAGSASRAVDGVWFPLPQDLDEDLEVPSWSPFPRTAARRFRAPG